MHLKAMLFTPLLLGASGAAAQDQITFTLHVPRLVASQSATLYIDGEGFRLRVPAEATFTITKERERFGSVVLLFALRDRPSPGMVQEWSARPTLMGSRHVVWTLSPTGGEEIIQWPLVKATVTSGPPLEVLIGGRLAGRTPLEYGVAPEMPQEMLWREPDGSTICIFDLQAIPADSTRSYVCDPSTKTARRVDAPPG